MTMIFLRCFFCFALAACLVSCGSSQEFFQLSATAAASTSSPSGSSIAVGPISLPNYVDRSELVFQDGANEFQVPSNASWVGSLPENVSRVLAEDLGRILHSSRVRTSLESGVTPRYQIAVDVRQFHGISGQEAILDVSWRVQSGGGGVLLRQSGIFHEPIVGDGYAPVVAAQSRLLEQLAAAIAQSLP